MLAPLYGFPDNGAFVLMARSLPPSPHFYGEGQALGPFWSGIRPAAAHWVVMCSTYTGERQIGKRLPIFSSSAQSRGHGRSCAVSRPVDASPLQLADMMMGQIRTRVRICRRCARVRMSAAGLSWTHPIRPFGGVRCFYAGGCGSLAGETARNRAADQIRQPLSDLPPPACFTVGKKSRTNGAVRSCDLWPETCLSRGEGWP